MFYRHTGYGHLATHQVVQSRESILEMATTFEAVGIGQWFRYVADAIEVAAAALLWVAGLQMIGGGLLTITMIGATFANPFVIGASAVPALVLGLLSAYIAFLHRGQLTAKRTTT